MPRIARQRSESGIYHIILRGTNRQTIFYDDKDRIRFLDTTARYKRSTGLKVHGWCLMNSHVHLLLSQGNEGISVTMKRITVSYASYFHTKYNSSGHLFQDRFKSEAVDDNNYLITVIRYIHQNPVKAGLVKSPAGWPWSSCLGYYGEECYPVNLLDSSLVLSVMDSSDKARASEMFKSFNERKNEDVCLEYQDKTRLTDDESRAEILKAIPGLEITMVKSLPKAQRDQILLEVKEIKGISHRQAARILEISPNLLFKA